jgi:hypothetical protein
MVIRKSDNSLFASDHFLLTENLPTFVLLCYKLNTITQNLVNTYCIVGN